MHDDTADQNSKIETEKAENTQSENTEGTTETNESETEGLKAEEKAPADSETDVSSASDEKNLKHVYFEVGNDLLSKPTALVDIIQAQGESPAVVFCNSPSEADFVDVMLKKHGLNCAKLIGHVPPMRISQAIVQVKEKTLDALVVTDVAARDLEVGAFEILINYSIHDDPEVYIHRIAAEAGIGNLKTIASIISPLDFGNFHYLRKLLDYEFIKAELPTEAMVFEAQAKRLIQKSTEGPHLTNERIKHIVPILLEDENKEAVVAMLCYNTLDILPGLMAGAEREENKDYRDRDRDRDRGDRDRGDRDRGRGRDRDRDRGRGRSYGRDRDRGDRRGGSSNRDSSYRDQGRSNDYRERTPLPPRKKDFRIYIGHGSDQDFSEEEFVKLIQENCQEISEEKIKRFSIRNCYSYVDLSEEVASSAVEGLKEAKRSNGDSLFLRKATTITAPREEASKESEDKGEQSEPAPETSPDTGEAAPVSMEQEDGEVAEGTGEL